MRQFPQACVQYFEYRNAIPVFGFMLEEPAQLVLFEHPDTVPDLVERQLVIVR